MTHALLGAKWVPDGDGHFVSTDTVALSEVIHDYDPTMSLVWIPPEDRLPGDTHPWGILHEPGGNIAPYIIFTLREDEIQNRALVLERLFRGDQRRHNVMVDINNFQAAQQLLELKDRQNALEEAKDVADHIWKSPKARYRHNGRVYE